MIQLPFISQVPFFINRVEVNYNLKGAVLQKEKRKQDLSREDPLRGWGGSCLDGEISCTDKPRAALFIGFLKLNS